jgi:hypothetical protein
MTKHQGTGQSVVEIEVDGFAAGTRSSPHIGQLLGFRNTLSQVT